MLTNLLAQIIQKRNHLENIVFQNQNGSFENTTHGTRCLQIERGLTRELQLQVKDFLINLAAETRNGQLKKLLLIDLMG